MKLDRFIADGGVFRSEGDQGLIETMHVVSLKFSDCDELAVCIRSESWEWLSGQLSDVAMLPQQHNAPKYVPPDVKGRRSC